MHEAVCVGLSLCACMGEDLHELLGRGRWVVEWPTRAGERAEQHGARAFRSVLFCPGMHGMAWGCCAVVSCCGRRTPAGAHQSLPLMCVAPQLREARHTGHLGGSP